MAVQLRRLSELTGNSQSKLISELLQESGTTFSRMIVVLEAAERAKKMLKTGSAARLSSAQDKMESELGMAPGELLDTSTLPLFEGDTVVRRARKVSAGGPGASTVEARSGRASGGSRASSSAQATPLSNRGVRSAKKGALHGQI